MIGQFNNQVDCPICFGKGKLLPIDKPDYYIDCPNCEGTGKIVIKKDIFTELEARVKALESHIHMYSGLEVAEDSETTAPFVEGEDNEGQEIWKPI